MCEGEGSEDKEGRFVLGLMASSKVSSNRLSWASDGMQTLWPSSAKTTHGGTFGLSSDAEPRTCIPDIEYI